MIATELLANAKDNADNSLRRDGRIVGVLYLHHIGGDMLAVPYPMAEISVGLQRQVIVETIKIMRRTNVFGGAVLIAEAWMSRMEKKNAAIGRVLMPSQDPDRTEIVTVLVVSHDGSKRFSCWELDRSGPFPRCGKAVGEHESVESWLDAAFKKEVA